MSIHLDRFMKRLEEAKDPYREKKEKARGEFGGVLKKTKESTTYHSRNLNLIGRSPEDKTKRFLKRKVVKEETITKGAPLPSKK